MKKAKKKVNRSEPSSVDDLIAEGEKMVGKPEQPPQVPTYSIDDILDRLKRTTTQVLFHHWFLTSVGVILFAHIAWTHFHDITIYALRLAIGIPKHLLWEIRHILS